MSRTSLRLFARWMLSALVGALPVWLGGGLAVFAGGPLVGVLVVTMPCGALAQYWVLDRSAACASVSYLALGRFWWTIFRSEPPKLWPSLFEGLPKSLGYALREPAFALE